MGFSIRPNKGLRNSLIQLHVHCTRQKEGCEWTGELGQLDGHLSINPEMGKHHIGCRFVERGQQVDKQGQDINELKRQQEQRGQQGDKQERDINELKRQQEQRGQQQEQRGQHISWWIIVALVVGIVALFMSNRVNYSSLRQEIIELQSRQERIEASHLEHGPVIPVTVTMDGFAQHKRKSDTWFSEPFYTHPDGYKMCLNVDASGSGNGEGTHVSVYVYLMRGEFDDFLEWPFRGNIIVQLLNQLADKEHHSITISFTDKTPDQVAGRVTTGERGELGWGWGKPTFISHKELYKANGAKYLQKDCLQFQVTKEDLVLFFLVFVFVYILVIISCLCCCLKGCRYLCCSKK